MKKKLNFNYVIASFISTLNIGMIRRLRFIKIVNIKLYVRILRILYIEGIIRTFVIQNDIILVYFKYINGKLLKVKLELISKPSKRCYLNLNVLSKIYNRNTFSGFYIVSTNKGLITTDYCLLEGHQSGEVLIKVSI